MLEIDFMSISLYSYFERYFIPEISDNFFEGNLNIGEIVGGYLTFFGCIPYVVDNISQNRTSNLTSRLVEFFSRNTQSIPSLSQCNPRKVDDLRKICLTLKGDYSKYIDLLDTQRFEIFTLGYVTDTVIRSLKVTCPVNLVDPVSLEEIATGDLFVSQAGHKLSISALATFHNTRPYRGSQGEQQGKKYIVNTYTNTFFSYKDSIQFIYSAVGAGQELIDLHPDAVVPYTDKSTPPPDDRWTIKSLALLYQDCRKKS